jgi:peptidoglycan hydrolase-like protein with peptidoglycan-binding domain
MALAAAGATGNFGTITRTALMEYQAAVRITPADGYYGPLTQAYVEHAPSSTTPTGSPTVSPKENA